MCNFFHFFFFSGHLENYVSHEWKTSAKLSLLMKKNKGQAKFSQHYVYYFFAALLNDTMNQLKHESCVVQLISQVSYVKITFL